MRNLAVLTACSCSLLIPFNVYGEADCDTSLLQHKLSLEGAAADHDDDDNGTNGSSVGGDTEWKETIDLLKRLAQSDGQTDEGEARTEASNASKPRANMSEVIKELATNALAGLPSDFETLQDDLTSSLATLGSVQDLLPKFKDAFNRVLEADKEAALAEGKKLKALAEMKQEVNTTIDLDSNLQGNLPAEVHSLLPKQNGLLNDTAAAVVSATTAAELAKVVVEAEKELAEALANRSEALRNQTELVASMRIQLETTILTALNDTRMVTALNDSDRLPFPVMKVYATTNTASTSSPADSVAQESPYPSEFVIIALLILLAIALAALASLHRPAAA